MKPSFLAALGLALCIAGCANRENDPAAVAAEPEREEQDNPPAANVSAATESALAKVNEHLRELEDKIARMEKQRGAGRGAMRYGSSLRVDGANEETVLERLRRLERELSNAKATVAQRSKEISDLQESLSTSEAAKQTLTERADVLEHAHDNLETAQQELADRQQRLTLLGEQLAASELMRLRIERMYYQLAANLVKLTPGQTQDLVDLQDHVRNQVKELEPQNESGKKQ